MNASPSSPSLKTSLVAPRPRAVEPRTGQTQAEHHTDASRDRPPVILLGGEANALSVVRDLGSIGVSVHFLCDRDTSARFSRYCRHIDTEKREGESDEAAWSRFLLGAESDVLRGAIVLACSDAGIQVLLRHRDALAERFRLDDANPVAQRAMLDKLATYKHAAAAGVATPRFWEVHGRANIEALERELVYPLMVKPRLSHVFEQRLGRKHVVVETFDALLAAYDAAADAELDVLLVEHVPGGDDRLCSYFTYLDEQSEPLFHFTKRVIRRFPSGMGGGCYHITDHIPELIEPSRALFKQVGLRGLANVEYKHDPRDGRYKLIECNARFVASDALVSAAGISLGRFVYNRVTGQSQQVPNEFRSGLRLWDPLRDVKALFERRRRGEITLLSWLGSVVRRGHTFPFFRWTDPMPAIARGCKPLARLLSRR